MAEHGYLIGGVILGALGLVAIFVAQRRASKTVTRRSWMSYLLVWPLILDADKEKRPN